jgi:hypothetical protein
MDPLVTLRPNKFAKIREYKQSINKLRAFMKLNIEIRMKEMEVDREAGPKDILTLIIDSVSNSIKTTFFKIHYDFSPC